MTVLLTIILTLVAVVYLSIMFSVWREITSKNAREYFHHPETFGWNRMQGWLAAAGCVLATLTWIVSIPAGFLWVCLQRSED